MKDHLCSDWPHRAVTAFLPNDNGEAHTPDAVKDHLSSDWLHGARGSRRRPPGRYGRRLAGRAASGCAGGADAAAADTGVGAQHRGNGGVQAAQCKRLCVVYNGDMPAMRRRHALCMKPRAATAHHVLQLTAQISAFVSACLPKGPERMSAARHALAASPWLCLQAEFARRAARSPTGHCGALEELSGARVHATCASLGACADSAHGGPSLEKPFPGSLAERTHALRRAHRAHLALGGLGLACFALEDGLRDRAGCGWAHAAWHCLSCASVAGVNALLRDCELVA